ncbi:PREDICTED: uncharacterized protein LOC108778822, partial [Cyphomyrmex costatus]|uniref:uncharacterized protein LOC108778822 n=1 Tax=Cyphomyrmex costatus TaxID=456900 RepID=UPI00085234A3
TYKRAREKEKLAEKLSDINTTSDEEENKRKRKLRCKKVLSSSESEDDNDDACVVAKLPKKNISKSLQLTYPEPSTSKSPSISSIMSNTHDIEKGRSDSDIDIEEGIEYNKSSNSDYSKNISDNNSENSVTYNTSKEPKEVEITNRVKKFEGLLSKKQNNYSVQLENQFYDTENKILNEKFPMKSLNNVKSIEQQLKHNETFKKQVSCREQLAIAEFARSLLIIPKTLAVNAAQDATDLVAKLRPYHNSSITKPDLVNLKW